MNRTILSAQTLYSMGTTLFLATYILHFQTIGLALDDIALIDVLFNIGILLFEVPTGVIVDRFGRRTSFILSCLVRGAALIGLAFGLTLPIIAALIFITAIGETLVSGAAEAWLISNLRKGTRVRDVYRSLALIGGATTILAGTTGAGLFVLSTALMWLASGGTLLIAALIAAFAPEGPAEATQTPHPRLSTILNETLILGKDLATHQPLVKLLILHATAAAGAGLFWQLVVIDPTLPAAPAIVWIAFCLSGMAGAWAARFAPDTGPRPGPRRRHRPARSLWRHYHCNSGITIATSINA